MGDVAGYLVQGPSFSLSPYFPIFLVVGVVILAYALDRIVEKPQGAKTDTNPLVANAAGIAVAGFVLVSWAGYQSVILSEVTGVLVVVAGILTPYVARKKITGNYKKEERKRVYAAIVLAVLFPLVAQVALYHAGSTPQVTVTPSDVFPTVDKAGDSVFGNFSVASVFGDSSNIRIEANSSNVIAAYLNKSLGPVEIPSLQHGRQVSYPLRIETSRLAPNGTYTVVIKYNFTSVEGKVFTGNSPRIYVTVGTIPIGTSTTTSTFTFTGTSTYTSTATCAPPLECTVTSTGTSTFTGTSTTTYIITYAPPPASAAPSFGALVSSIVASFSGNARVWLLIPSALLVTAGVSELRGKRRTGQGETPLAGRAS